MCFFGYVCSELKQTILLLRKNTFFYFILFIAEIVALNFLQSVDFIF